MKKVFFLIAFLFTVVCYAAPPPDNLASLITEEVEVFRSHGDIAVQALEVQEVTLTYIGKESHPFNQHIANCGFINRLPHWKINKQNTNFGYPFGADF